MAIITWQKPNLLLLDEPTNHFDIEMREALALALQDYEGAVLLVAHDKNLMESVVDEFWVVSDGKVTPFAGDLTDYQKWLNENKWGANVKASNESKNHSAQNKKEQKRLDAERRQQKAPLTNRLKKVDQLMAKLQKEQTELEASLADTAVYNDENKAKLTLLLSRSGEVNEDLESLEEEWLELHEKIEAFE